MIPARWVRETLSASSFRRRAIAGGVVAMLLWVIVSSAGVVQRDLLPTPLDVLSAIVYLHFHQALVRSAIASLLRVTLGFGVAALIAVPLGILSGALPRVRAWILPTMAPLRNLPLAGVLPLTILWFGFGETQKIAGLVIGVVFYLFLAVNDAIVAVEPTYLALASTLGASGWQRVTRVLVPAAAPVMWEAARNLYGVGWTYVLMAEALRADYGLGALTIAGQRLHHADWVFAVIVVILALGFAVDALWAFLGKALFPWQETR